MGQLCGVPLLRRASIIPTPTTTIAAPITTPTIAPVLLESSDEASTVVGTTTAPVSVATTVPSVVPSVSSGAGVRSAAVGGPSVTLMVGAGFSGSGAPSTGMSSQGISPT